MDVHIFHGLGAAQDTKGICVVIDVFRATSTIPCLLESRPNKVILAADRAELSTFMGREKTFIFTDHKDVSPRYDNSPTTALTMELADSDVVISTMNGTKALASVSHCPCVIAGSFVNLTAVCEFIKNKNPETVSLLAIGHIDINQEAIEDTLCAEMYADVLVGKKMDETYFKQKMDAAIDVRADEFSDRKIPHSLMADFMLCQTVGKISKVPVVQYGEHLFCVNGNESIISVP